MWHRQRRAHEAPEKPISGHTRVHRVRTAGLASQWERWYLLKVDARRRFNVIESGVADGPPIVLVHGFGCDQSMWRWMRRPFEASYRVVSYDLMGLGESDRSDYEPGDYDTLQGHADDLVELIDDLDLHDVVVVGHSVAAMIAADFPTSIYTFSM